MSVALKKSPALLRRVSLNTGIAALAGVLAITGPVYAASVTSTGTIALTGTAGPTCSINVVPDSNAGSLPIAVDNASHTTTVGRVEQDCNNSGGYTLDVTSLNCTTGGARLDGPGANELQYSVNSDNGSPNPDGTWDVTGLLDVNCTGEIARTATAPVTDYFTDFAVVFTASTSLFPGAYTDTLTITLTASY
jgi:spore coat protein U-like protein